MRDEVDRLNVLRATHEAMRRAVLGLARRPDHASDRRVAGAAVPDPAHRASSKETGSV